MAQAIGVSQVAGLQQIHGNRAIRISQSSARTERADAMATDVPGLALCIRAADCQNIIVYEPTRHVLGIMHVGWKGLEAGMIKSLYELLKREWGIEPAETYVAAGPSLGKECAEFTDPAREMPSIASTFINGRNIDLAGAADHQLRTLGVRADRMERMTDCTKCHPEKYWTYRGGDREAVQSGQTNMLVCVMNETTDYRQ